MTEFEKEVLHWLSRIAANTSQTLTILERIHPEALNPRRRKDVEYWNKCHRVEKD